MSLVQRVYVYVVAIVAVHMIVLGVANLLRVFAELALSAPSGGFTGLPFLFADFSRPRELYREQASLAIALLLVGTPAWWIHYGLAARAVARDVAERATGVRSLYVHVVVFVTALLVFGYGQRTLRLILQGTTFGQAQTDPNQAFGLEANWEARAAGAGAMALAAAVTLAFHLRLSLADRVAVAVRGRAAEVRQLALYALVVVGLFFAAFTTVTTLDGIWRRIVDIFVTLPGIPANDRFGPGGPSQDEFLRFELLGAIPRIVAGLALWLGAWIPIQRGLVRGPDVDVERRSIVRKLAIYLVVFVSALAVLVAATIALSVVGRRVLGDLVVEQYSSLWHELGFPLTTLPVFGALWLFHRRVVEGEASRETELARAATIRRLYTYLICAIGLAMAAIGAAGTIGVFGSQVLGVNAHSNGETATYLSLLVVGAGAWAYHWRQARARLDDDERTSQPRRLYLYLAVLGGVLGMLVFGSAALYRLLNAVLAFSFPLETWHDIWHFVVDAGVSAAAFVTHLRILRAERAAGAAVAPMAEQFAFLVRMSGADRDVARERIAQALPDATVVQVRTTPDGPGAVSIDSLTPIEQGPSIVVVLVAVLVALLLIPTVLGLLVAPSVSPPVAEPPVAKPLPYSRGALLWQDTASYPVLATSGDVFIGQPVTVPAIVELTVNRDAGTTGVFEWTIRDAEGDRVYMSMKGELVELVSESTRSGTRTATFRDPSRPATLVAYLDPVGTTLESDGAMVGAVISRDAVERVSVRVAVRGEGRYVVTALRVYEALPPRR